MIQYYLRHGAATVWILRYSLNMSKPKAYRLHKLIEECGLIEIKTTIVPIGNMKRPASIWGRPNSTEAQIKGAYQYHLKLRSPIYRKADKITKRYLQEGRPALTSYRELILYLKEINEFPRMRQDVARMMMNILSRELRMNVKELSHSDIIQHSIEYFKTRGMIGIRKPPQWEVGAYIKREHPCVEGSEVAQLAGQISQMLYKEFARI